MEIPNYIVAASPDKLSLGAFIRYVRKIVGNDYMVGEMHSLMSVGSITAYIQDFFNRYQKAIVSYYAKRVINRDPIKCIPEGLISKADFLIWFDIYSMEIKILKKSNDEFNDHLVNNWIAYVKMLER